MTLAEELRHHLKFFRATVLINLTRETQYRLDFLVGILATVGWTLISLVFLLAIYGKVPNIAGWPYSELIALLGFYRLVEGIGELIFYRSFKRFSEDIRRGRLDTLLTKPVDFQFYISTRYLSIDSVSSGLVGLCLFVYGLRHSTAALTPSSLFLFALLFFCGVLVHYSFWVLIHSLNFWLVKVDNLRNLVHGVVSTSRFPPEAYGRKAEIFLSFVIPLALIAAFPIKVLLARAAWWYLPFSLVVSMLLFVLSRRFFFYALRFYASEGG